MTIAAFTLSTLKKKRVLVAPLEWGLGHATRCVPVIKELLRQGAEVILAADGRPYAFLEKEFPELPIVRFPGYGITYPANDRLALHLALRLPGIRKRIKEEQQAIEKIVDEHAIDIIISDNRFACRTSRTHNVYITHQLHVKAPFAEKFISNVHKKYYDRFDEIWVPDTEGPRNLSGELGHTELNNPFIRYVSSLTRFEDPGPWNSRPMKWWLVALLSGPEPQRTIFENLLLEELSKFTEETLIIRGTPEGAPVTHHDLQHVKMVDHLADADMENSLLSTHLVLSRPGYSTICDLSALGISPIVVPTPGQTEQEYLAHYHEQGGRVVVMQQKNMNLSEAIRKHTQMLPFNIYPEHSLLERRVKSLLQ